MHCDPSLSFLGLLGAPDEVGFTVRRQSIPSRVTLFKKFFFRIYFWLLWSFVALLRLPLVSESGGYSLVVVPGLFTELASLVVGHRL